MPLLQRVVKPKTHKGKKFLENRAPKLTENEKTVSFVRGSTSSQVVLQAMRDFWMLKKPHGVFFNRKNDIRPFENATSLEFFCQKNDTSLFMFSSHNKKRPHNLVIGRTYDFHLLDMFEFGVEDFKCFKEYKIPKIASETKPLLVFSGDVFETQPEYQRLKNLFIDLFRGPEVSAIRLKGLQHVMVFTAADGKIYFRSYKIVMKKTENKAPDIELVEIGPHMNFVMRRTKLASEDLFKQARKQPKQLKPKKKKNISKNKLGTKLGRIHMKRQDFKTLCTRKSKGLRKADKKPYNAAGKRRVNNVSSNFVQPLKRRKFEKS